MKNYFLSIVILLLGACYSKSSSSNTSLLLPLVLIKTDILSIQSSSENASGGNSPYKYESIENEKFWVYNVPKNKVEKRDVDLVTQSINYKIWIQNGAQSDVYVSMNDYVNELENTIHPILIKNFGKHKDLNKDDKVNILISNTIDDRTGGYVAGYVTPTDYTNSNTSNKRDILYMNSRSSNNKNSFYSTTIHELQHLYRIKYQDLENSIFDTKWINEGTSEYISDEAGYGPQKSRLNCYYSSCQVNGSSIFDKSNTVGLYAFRYMFISYLYHSASSDKENRASFVYKLTTGFTDKNQTNKTSTRANNAKGFFQSFHTYASKHTSNKGILGSDYQEIFYKLYGSFLFQTNPLSISKYNTSKQAQKDTSGTLDLDFSSIISNYPLPDDLTKVYSSGRSVDGRGFFKFQSSTPAFNTERSGEFYFYKGVPTTKNKYISFTNRLRDRNGQISSYTLQYNYSMSSFGNIEPSIMSSNLNSSFTLDTTYLNKSYQEDTPICIHDQLNKKLQHELDKNITLQFISE